jgi:hypothetical protein
MPRYVAAFGHPRTSEDVAARRRPKIVWEGKLKHADKDRAARLAVETLGYLTTKLKLIPYVGTVTTDGIDWEPIDTSDQQPDR